MKQILFRGIDKWTRVWYYWNEYGDFCSESGKIKRVEVLNSRGVSSYYYSVSSIKHRIEKESTSQYTGMRDKNGKRIFEGDILLFECGYKYYYEVFFENGAFCYFEDKKTKNARSFKDFLSSTNCIVIGNKWDNPELLEKCRT